MFPIRLPYPFAPEQAAGAATVTLSDLNAASITAASVQFTYDYEFSAPAAGGTLYAAIFASAQTPTWSRENIPNGRHGFSATGYSTSGSRKSGVPTSGTGNDVAGGITLSGLTASTPYRIWLIWDDGTNTSNSGVPLASAEFTTAAFIYLTFPTVTDITATSVRLGATLTLP